MKSFLLKFKKYLLIVLTITMFSWLNVSAQCTLDFSFLQSANGQVSFTPLITNGGTISSCDWYFGDNTYQSVASAINVNNSYQYNYTARVCLQVYSTLCSDSICKDVVITSAQPALCNGNAAFTYTSNGSLTDFTNTAGSYWYITDFGDGQHSYYPNSGNISHQYHLNGTYQVTAVSYLFTGNNFGLVCDTSVQTITVNNIPCIADFELYADTLEGDFFASDLSLGDANQTWYLNGVVNASNTQNISGILTPGNYTICLVTTGANGCYDSICKSFTMNYVLNCSTVSFSYSAVAGQCDTYQFNVNNGGTTLTSIDWSLNGNLISNSSSFIYTLPFAAGSNSSSEVICQVAAAGCASSVRYVFYKPSEFFIDLDTIGGINTWYAYPNTSGGSNELWDFGDGTTSTLPYPTHVYAIPGFYNVCHTITTSAGCNYSSCINQYFYRTQNAMNISNFIVVGPTSINETQQSSLKRIYPNPADDKVNVIIDADGNKNKSLQITNVLGMLMHEIKIQEGAEEISLSVKDLPNGIYFLRILEDNRILQIERLMISR